MASTATKPEWQPRPLRAVEAEVILRLLQFPVEAGADLSAFHESVDRLIVREGCDCGCDALFFDNPRNLGQPIAHGVGITVENRYVELVLWARATTLTFLELEPQTIRRPWSVARLPEPDTLQPIEDNFYDLAYVRDPRAAWARRLRNT